MSPQKRAEIARKVYEEMLARVRVKSSPATWQRLRRAAENLRSALDDVEALKALGTIA